jgi:hypothetical protein
MAGEMKLGVGSAGGRSEVMGREMESAVDAILILAGKCAGDIKIK